MFRTPLFALVLCALATATVPAQAARTLTYREILSQLTDLDRLTLPQEGVSCGIASSWDRREKDSWGANGDAGQYERVDPNGEAVMMDVDGPGCIYRIWSANPQGKIRVYLDGAATPSFEWDFEALFSGDGPPFIKPIAYRRGPGRAACDSYLPISFATHIKVVADQKRGQYYHLNYLLFPKDWTVPSFHLPLTAEEDAVLKQAAATWTAAGTDPKPAWPGQAKKAGKVTVAPGKTAEILAAAGPGEVRAIRMRVKSDDPRVWRKLVLRGTWDNAAWAQVLAPVGSFFGFDWEQPEYTSLIAGCKGGQCYFYYPMPYRRSAKLELVSFLNVPAEVEYEVETAPERDAQAQRCYFFARWRHEPKAVPFDYTFIETAGRGHLVGITHQIDHPIPGWWGEGDEKVWVDGDAFPRWIGTGSEDYYGDAWGVRFAGEASFGDSVEKNNHSCPYRWHFVDFVPFSERLRMTIENYGPSGRPAPHEYEHNSTAFWYQQELTPPFAQLAGKTYLGSDVIGVPPSEQRYRPDLFPDLDAEALRTTGLDVPFALEAEALLAGKLPVGARIVDDAGAPYQLNAERGVDFGQVREGQTVAELDLPVADRNVYTVRLLVAPLADSATLRVEAGGTGLAGTARPQPNVLDLGALALAPGGEKVKLVAASSGRLVLDAVQLLPASKAQDAIEAEELPVVAGTARPSAPLAAASSGRVLNVEAAAGGGATVRFEGARNLPFVLAVQPILGPDAGTIQAWVDGIPIGPAYDLYSRQTRPADGLLPLGRVEPKVKDVEIRVVGKNQRSGGTACALDYFRFDPVILGPGTPPDVWAQVARTLGCQYRVQPLGAAWYCGHHLWLQPSSNGAFVEIRVTVPREGDWALSARYTTSHDYARVQASLDGKPLGQPVDCYTPDVRLAAPTEFGKVHLTAGTHTLRFQAAGKNEASTNYLMGIDYVALKPGE